MYYTMTDLPLLSLWWPMAARLDCQSLVEQRFDCQKLADQLLLAVGQAIIA